ncbi:MAG TPA: peptidyl-alpha-hydroxyglycine alpha-amidating lyase family protein [Longimicrobiaceae bacterium]|jgi:sugar lactone lactonase YvrE|nr:peptidyl-alpha-hydroxyglycine alpha-amidating lyase family protein [Longimicrobiaceae bacterium]
MIPLLILALSAAPAPARPVPADTTPAADSVPALDYRPVPGFPTLPPSLNFGEVSSVEATPDGHLFVFHRGAQPLAEFDAAGRFVRSYAEGLVTHPHGVRVDAGGNIWLTDDETHHVLKLDPAGHVRMVLGRRGKSGDSLYYGEMLFNRPTDVAVAPNGDIYVADGYGNSRVVKLDRDGRFLLAWGTKGTGPGEFNVPHSVVIDASGRVIVADRENGRIQVFDADGRFLAQWGGVGKPAWLDLSPDGRRLFVADGANGRVLEMDLQGRVLGAFGRTGKASGQMDLVHGLAVGPHGEVYTAEILDWRTQKFVPAPRR